MEKRPSLKNRKLAKQPVDKKMGPSATRNAGTGRFLSPSKTIPWQSVSDRERASSNSVIDPIIDRATEVIGDRQEAMRWLGAPVRGLDFATPISLLATEEGQMRVNDILGQMEHGIW